MKRSSTRLFRKAALYTLSAALLAAPAALTLHGRQASAQAPAARNVTGDVTDKAGNKVKGAVVHLKDTRSLSQRSYITAEDGVFRFNQLSTSTDYDIWADADGKKSAVKSISSFDAKSTVEISLKMQD